MAADSAVIIHEWISTPEKDWLDAEHTGYTRLAQPVRHRRIFLFEKWKGAWTITDLLTSEGMQTADWYLHFDHGIEILPIDEGVFRTQSKETNLVIAVDGGIPLTFRIMDGWVSRRYGHKLPAKILHMQGTFNSTCRVVLTLHTAQGHAIR
jgi:hypothetical protein